MNGLGLVIIRTRLLPKSPMNRLPTELSETPLGALNWAEPAGPPSPEKPTVPTPATVEMMPALLTRRMRWLPASAM